MPQQQQHAKLEDEREDHEAEDVVAHHNSFFGFCCVFISCLCIVDIVLNASIEYNDLPSAKETKESNDTILTIVQVLLQIFVIVTFFTLLGATFLFRSGLFSILYMQFRLMFLLQPLYLLLTIVLGSVRSHALTSGTALEDIWDVQGYTFLSILQKLSAVSFYYCSVHTVEKLRQPKFYNHAYWLRH